MQETRLTFESENLVVDYISFNIQGLVGRKQVEIIAKYFFQILGFNSTFAKGSTGIFVAHDNNFMKYDT